MMPTSGPVGTLVTVRGMGFTASSTVQFGGMAGVAVTGVSPDGSALTFLVPRNLGPICERGRPCPEFIMLVRAGMYDVTVTTGGRQFAAGSFMVTGGELPTRIFPIATGTPMKPVAPAH